jgi:hypothetical protein
MVTAAPGARGKKRKARKREKSDGGEVWIDAAGFGQE